jgi:ubiquinone/menaquinone biosynthesis C-methylase UbiE
VGGDLIHPTAAEGFEKAADVYERARPGYPADAVDYVVEQVGDGLVVDLAAGTGKFTRELVARGLNCIAIEPVEGMRRTFHDVLPDVPIVDGSAEAMPVEDGSADAVTVAQAFHWFDGALAVAEIARVLRPGGRLAVVWNVRDARVDWVSRVTEIIDRYENDKHVPRYRDQEWRKAFEKAELFRLVAEREFPYMQEMTREGLVDRVASTSFIATLDEAERMRVLEEVGSLASNHPDLAGRARFEHPYVTEVYVFERAD